MIMNSIGNMIINFLILKELPELIHSLFSALFGFGILPNDEKRIVRVIGDIAKIQIAEYQGPISSFFLRQTALSLSFRYTL